nr:MAG TPA: hypothetical protein [Caudoviricetes sp.]
MDPVSSGQLVYMDYGGSCMPWLLPRGSDRS